VQISEPSSNTITTMETERETENIKGNLDCYKIKRQKT